MRGTESWNNLATVQNVRSKQDFAKILSFERVPILQQGWGLLGRFSPFRYFPHFSLLSKQTLALEYHVYIWQVSPQLSCGDTCQIWMWFRESNRYFCKIENFAYGEISERSFSTPTPGLHPVADDSNILSRQHVLQYYRPYPMMTSWHGNSFYITGLLWGESISNDEFPLQRDSEAEINIFFVVRLNKLLKKRAGWTLIWKAMRLMGYHRYYSAASANQNSVCALKLPL